MMVLQYLLVVYLVLTGFFTPIMLFVFLSLYGFLKLIVPVYRAPKPARMPEEYRAEVWPLWFVVFCTTAALGRCSCSASPSRSFCSSSAQLRGRRAHYILPTGLGVRRFRLIVGKPHQSDEPVELLPQNICDLVALIAHVFVGGFGYLVLAADEL